MMVIRPIAMSDLDRLVELVENSQFGMTSLPRDRDFLRKRITLAERSFSEEVDRPGGEVYLFALEDTHTGQMAGLSGIVSKVGGFDPFYAYQILTTLHESEILKVRKEVKALHLVKIHSGPAEIGSLLLDPAYRGGGNGRLLSLARFLFMANEPERFDPMVIAEMRGVVDAAGHSPFWESLGQHFFDVDFPTADRLSMLNRKFIADLMPAHPIYIPLLPQAAQAVIGQVHEQTGPALHMLQREGFEFAGMVDIFDGGPVYQCERPRIRSVRDSQVGEIVDIAQSEPDRATHLVATVHEPSHSGGTVARDRSVRGSPGAGGSWGFRACLGHVVSRPGEGVEIDRAAAHALQVERGATVRYVTLKPTPSATAEHVEHQPVEYHG